jgi:SAM-dependent methyltransferase
MREILQRKCPLCGNDNSMSTPNKYSKDGWKIKNCSRCKFVYLENCVSYDLLINDFAWEKTSRAKADEKKNRGLLHRFASGALEVMKTRVLKRDKLPKLINKHFEKGNVLDIGCGSGGVLKNLDDRYIPFGIEISEYLAICARAEIQEKRGYVIHSDAISGLDKFENCFFSGIILSAFLEHETSPIPLLVGCSEKLRNGGKIVIKVPNYGCVNRVVMSSKWCGFRHPDHVNYFTPRTLEAMCKMAGYEIERFNFLDKLPLSDNMWMIIRKP